ncbi:MAG: NB-ARC domain-containing protein [Gelidibacter sp.]|nr:hypothetical protein [Lewinellaceae bacterium]
MSDRFMQQSLPNPSYDRFIGRTESVNKIVAAIKHKRTFIITISGIGGVGKSAIAIKTANNIILGSESLFNFIIWVSAKKTYLRPEGIIIEEQHFSTLNQLLDVILNVTGFYEFKNLNFKAKREYCLNVLGIDSFLLIIDNFETISKPNEFLEFFEEIGNVCDETKVVLTTRHQLGYSEKIIDIKEFSKSEYIEFFNYLVNEKFKINTPISPKVIDKFFHFTGGVPLATEFLLGQVGIKNPIERLVAKIENKEFARKEEILEFSYNESFELLNPTERKVLFSISLIDNPRLSNVAFTCGIDEIEVEEVLVKLKNLSFINIGNIDSEQTYSSLPLTKIFLEDKLEKDHKTKEELSLKIKEYSDILKIQAFKSHEEFEISNEKEDTSIMFAKAAYKRAQEGDFKNSEEYFAKAKGYNDNEPYVWYYLAKAELDFSNNLQDDYFNKAVKLSKSIKDKEMFLLEWGRALYGAKKHIDATIKLNEAINLNKNNKGTYHVLGKSYYEIGKNLWKKNSYFEMKKNYHNSADAFVNSLYANPSSYFEENSNAVGYHYLAKIYIFIKDLTKAKEFIDKGLKLQPQNFRLRELMDEINDREDRPFSKFINRKRK